MSITKGEYPVVHPRGTFWQFWQKIAKNSFKTFPKKLILANFVSLFRTFCPNLSKETDFYF